MSIGVKYEWVNGNKDIAIFSLSGNHLYTVRNARVAFYNSDGSITVRGNAFETIKFSPNGIRSFS